jgi:hypothetical protein
MAASRLDIKREASAAVLLAQYLWVVGSVGVVLGPVFLKRKPVLWIPFAGLLLIAVVVGFLASRSRSPTVFLGASLLVGIWMARQIEVVDSRGLATRRPRQLRAPSVGALLALMTFAVVVVSYARSARGFFEQDGVRDLIRVDVQDAIVQNLRNGDFGYAATVFDVLEYVPEQTSFLRGRSYYRLLFVPIPRSLWPEKPQNTQRVVASWLRPSIPEHTTPPGIQGDLYINFGLTGVLGFIAFGWCFGHLDRLHGLHRYLAIGGAVVPVFHLVRGGFTNPVLLLFTLIMASKLAAAMVESQRGPRRFRLSSAVRV